MPFGKGFYAPLDWYDPTYQPPTLSQQFKLTPIEKSPISFGKFDQLKLMADALGWGGERLDELYRGNTRDNPDWKVAGMPDLPGKGGASLAKKVSSQAKKLNKAKAVEQAVSDVVKESKVDPITQSFINAVRANKAKAGAPLPEISGAGGIIGEPLGFQPKPAQLRQLEQFPFLPNRVAVGTGPSKVVTEGLVPEAVSKGPRVPPSRDFLAEMGIAPKVNPPLRLDPTRMLPETGTGRLPDLPELPASQLGGVRPPTDLPPLDLESFFRPKPDPTFGHPLLGGRRETLIPNAKTATGSLVQHNARNIWDSLRSHSATGQAISDLMQTTRLDAESFAGQLKEASRAIRKPIEKDPKLWREFVEVLDTGRPIAPEFEAKLKPIIDWHRQADRALVARAEKSGMGFLSKSEGKLLPFQGRENYWPHIYGEKFFKDTENQALALAKKYGIKPEEARNIIVRAREHGGLLIPESQTARQAAMKQGERYISPQHGRELDLAGWRTDPGALDTHYTNMAKRIIEAEKYGPMDIADPKSPLGKLLGSIPQDQQPEIRAMLERMLGRDKVSGAIKSKTQKGVSNLLKTEAGLHLSMFPISNTNQVAAVPLRAGIIPTAKAAIRKVTDRAGVRQRAFRSGAMEAADTDALQEVGGRSLINKAFGISRSEKTVRSLANEAGQISILDDFAKLKKNPTNDRLRNRLEEFTRTPANELLAQDKLTQEQINRAGARMSEVTMGRAQAGDLPYHWSSGPLSESLLLFKKYGYRQGHTMLNAIRENPVKNIPLALLGFQVAGETTGDIKAAIKGAVSGTIKEGAPIKGAWQAIKERGQWMKNKNPALNRIIDNYTQAWLLGLPGDALAALAKDDKAVWQLIGGPIAGDVVDVGMGAFDLIAQGDPTRLATKAARSIPYIGAGAAAGMKPPPKKTGTRSRRRR